MANSAFAAAERHHLTEPEPRCEDCLKQAPHRARRALRRLRRRPAPRARGGRTVRALVAAVAALGMVALTFGWPVIILGYHVWRGE